jgi:hypothetical protein
MQAGFQNALTPGFRRVNLNRYCRRSRGSIKASDRAVAARDVKGDARNRKHDERPPA